MIKREKKMASKAGHRKVINTWENSSDSSNSEGYSSSDEIKKPV